MMNHAEVLERPARVGAPAQTSQRHGRMTLGRYGRDEAQQGVHHAQRQEPTSAAGRRRHEQPAAWAMSAHAAPAEQSAPWTIEKVIEERGIRTLFQPIVHVETRSVVGFEALTRGPQGSELESPVALLKAAEDAGRLGELDWLCRVSALVAAADSGLPASLAWFVNVEPAGLDTPCPEHLLADFALASANLRVMFEFVERGIEEHSGTLLSAAEEVRRNSWGVALDDVGAVAGSLAMLPVVQPDLVKLDRCLLQPADQEAATQVVTAVRAYAECRGAAIVAEGIETEEDEEIARTFGAEFGQGYRYGRPGPLPASVPTPRHVVPMRRRAATVDERAPFDALFA